MNRYRDIVSQQHNRLANLIQQANQAKFIIKHISSKSFKLLAEDNTAYRVSIGQLLFCTCTLINRHCIHTIYILINFYKVSPQSDILRAQSYNEIDLLKMEKYQLEYKSSRINNQLPSNKFIGKRQINFQQTLQHSINYDKVCAICQQDLEILPIHFCKDRCGTNFHAECLYRWVYNRKMRTCPICRKVWPETIVQELKQIKDTILIHKDYKCQICQLTPIKGQIYVCPQCLNWGMCQNCYFKIESHRQNHQIYLTRQFSNEIWTWTGNEIEFIFNLLQDPLALQEQRMTEKIQNKQQVKMLLLGRTVKTPQAKQEIECDFCEQFGECKQLACGHLVDKQCLIILINDQLKCSICEQKIFNNIPKGKIKAQEFQMPIIIQKKFSISKPFKLKLNLKNNVLKVNQSTK